MSVKNHTSDLNLAPLSHHGDQFLLLSAEVASLLLVPLNWTATIVVVRVNWA